MSLLVDVKTRLVNLRNDAWQPLFEEVISHFVMQKKKDSSAKYGWANTKIWSIKNARELNHSRALLASWHFLCSSWCYYHWDESSLQWGISSELLVSFSSIDPRNPFSKFDIDKIARLTKIYDQDFSNADPSNIRDQLQTFILHVPRIDDFVGCHYFGSLAIKIVETEKNVTFPLV